MKRIRLWDLPTRLFHWLLLLAIVAIFITGKIGGNYMDLHAKLGIFIVGLVIFRIVWGVIGSTYARFWNFIPSPKELIGYFKGQWNGVGHNPLGAFSVLALLAIVSFQMLTGLFSYNDTTFTFGPLAPLLDSWFHMSDSTEFSSRLTSWHRIASNVLIIFVVLHVLAISFYTWFKKQSLLLPMITGWKNVKDEEARSAQGGGLVAFIVAVAIAALAAWGASGIWIPKPEPVVVETPDW